MPTPLPDDERGGLLAGELVGHLAGQPRLDVDRRVVEQLLRGLRLGVDLVARGWSACRASGCWSRARAASRRPSRRRPRRCRACTRASRCRWSVTLASWRIGEVSNTRGLDDAAELGHDQVAAVRVGVDATGPSAPASARRRRFCRGSRRSPRCSRRRAGELVEQLGALGDAVPWPSSSAVPAAGAVEGGLDSVSSSSRAFCSASSRPSGLLLGGLDAGLGLLAQLDGLADGLLPILSNFAWSKASSLPLRWRSAWS